MRKEVIKLRKVDIIYPINESGRVSHTQVVLEKGGITVIISETNELFPSRSVMGWCMYIEYLKLSEPTHKDHFPLPCNNQILERLASVAYYCFSLWIFRLSSNSYLFRRSR
ncbi:hypothetical protein ACH5RR_021589 [Cinchona calisaya]|uniref:Uncharacterized protein n=1 Tax=Cinchona calisaya TaxID=153742 RepID=A0ABD2ZLA6_9GENT